jgi:hypothetical protein
MTILKWTMIGFGVILMLGLVSPHAAFGEDYSGFEFGMALGGGPALMKIDDRLTSTASGSSTLTVGGAWSSGAHMDLLIESYHLRPLDGGTSERMLPDGYLMDFGMIGLRLGQRWGRFHIWGDAAVGSMQESGDTFENYDREYQQEYANSMLGVGIGLEFIKWDSVSMEAFASAKQLHRFDVEQPRVGLSRTSLVQSYGVGLNFYPGNWSAVGPDYTTTRIYCFDCGYHLMRAIVEVGAIVLPEIGAAVTQVAFSALR